MEKETSIKEEVQEQFSEILLVLDKKRKKIQAVKNINEKGEMESVDPTKKNQSQFMRVDKLGDFVSNFLSNFIRQLKDPTRFSFFKVPANNSTELAKKMQKHVNKPTPEGKKLMEEHEVKLTNKKEEQQKKQNQMETKQTAKTDEYRYKPEQIDWETMNNLGLGKERLEKMNLLEPLLKGYKTNQLVPVSVNLGTAIIRTDARLSLQPNKEGKIVAAIHGIRKNPNLNFEFFGHRFTDEDKQNLLETGNMGRIVDLTNPKTGETIPSVVSVDRMTNELIAFRAQYIKVPGEIKGIKLEDTQKQTLMEGKPLYLEGMISKKGTPFNATLQFNADKGYVEFLFNRNNKQQSFGKQQNQGQEAPKVFRGKNLGKEQYQKFKDGQTIYVDGLIDKKGKKYQGYITYNKETGKTQFSFQNPDKLRKKAQPTEAHKTQTSVNSEGKTNEATKHIKEPLNSKQQAPVNNKQQVQEEQPKMTKKSKGRKM